MNNYVRTARCSENQAIQIITIDRPPRNAMTLECYKQLLGALEEINRDQTVECAILTGAGDKSFVAGGDLNEHAQLDAESAQFRTSLIRRVFNTIRELRVPVIAAVNGYALGGGLALMASCDITVASENAKFSLPEVKVGIMGGTRHLRRLVPEQTVRWMALTGEMISADFFFRLGAIQALVPAEELMQAATKVALDICKNSPAATSLMKEALNVTEHMPLQEGYHVECFATSVMKSMPDGQEAVNAMLEKRSPNFKRT